MLQDHEYVYLFRKVDLAYPNNNYCATTISFGECDLVIWLSSTRYVWPGVYEKHYTLQECLSEGDGEGAKVKDELQFFMKILFYTA